MSLIVQVATPMLSRVTWALLKLLVITNKPVLLLFLLHCVAYLGPKMMTKDGYDLCFQV